MRCARARARPWRCARPDSASAPAGPAVMGATWAAFDRARAAWAGRASCRASRTLPPQYAGGGAFGLDAADVATTRARRARRGAVVLGAYCPPKDAGRRGRARAVVRRAVRARGRRRRRGRRARRRPASTSTTTAPRRAARALPRARALARARAYGGRHARPRDRARAADDATRARVIAALAALGGVTVVCNPSRTRGSGPARDRAGSESTWIAREPPRARARSVTAVRELRAAGVRARHERQRARLLAPVRRLRRARVFRAAVSGHLTGAAGPRTRPSPRGSRS